MSSFLVVTYLRTLHLHTNTDLFIVDCCVKT